MLNNDRGGFARGAHARQRLCQSEELGGGAFADGVGMDEIAKFFSEKVLLTHEKRSNTIICIQEAKNNMVAWQALLRSF